MVGSGSGEWNEECEVKVVWSEKGEMFFFTITGKSQKEDETEENRIKITGQDWTKKGQVHITKKTRLDVSYFYDYLNQEGITRAHEGTNGRSEGKFKVSRGIVRFRFVLCF